MTSLIIFLGVVLVLAILYMIYRVSSLVSIAKGYDDDKIGTANKVNAALFIVFMVGSLAWFFWYSFAYYDNYTLPVASEHGAHTDLLFWITMGVTVVAFVIISIMMFVFIYQYHIRKEEKLSTSRTTITLS
jgi:cytochrome c oxidase subunit 2